MRFQIVYKETRVRFRIHKHFIHGDWNSVQRGVIVRKSKLGWYEDILEVLVNRPLTIDQAAYELDMDCTILRKRLDFLIRNRLVEERGSGKTISYAITEKGVRVLRALNFPKYLEKITNKITVIDETLQVLREFEDRNRKKRSSMTK